jgi:hypothetical protein
VSSGLTSAGNASAGSGGGASALSAVDLEANPTNLAAAHPPIGPGDTVLEVLVAALILVAMAAPVFARRVRTRRRRVK